MKKHYQATSQHLCATVNTTAIAWCRVHRNNYTNPSFYLQFRSFPLWCS